MTNIRIAFIVVAGINIGLTLIRLVLDEDEKTLKFNAIAGWTCAILYAIP